MRNEGLGLDLAPNPAVLPRGLRCELVLQRKLGLTPAPANGTITS